REGAVKHLWKLSDYKPEADEPDEVALKGVLKRLRAEADYAFEPDDGTPVPAPKTKYGLEMKGEQTTGGRGKRNEGGDGTILTPDHFADPTFMLNPRNKAIIAEHVKRREAERAEQHARTSGPIIR